MKNFNNYHKLQWKFLQMGPVKEERSSINKISEILGIKRFREHVSLRDKEVRMRNKLFKTNDCDDKISVYKTGTWRSDWKMADRS